MRKYPPEGHATGQFAQYVGFGRSRGLPVAFCQLAGEDMLQYPSKPPVQSCFGMDKGGSTSTVKAFLGTVNQRHPASVGDSIVLGVFHSQTDD